MSGLPNVPSAREDLVHQLLKTGYIHSCNDFCRVATFLQGGRGGDMILVMEELNRWPDAHSWLRGRLCYEPSLPHRGFSGPVC
jgi:hypothetical protein